MSSNDKQLLGPTVSSNDKQLLGPIVSSNDKQLLGSIVSSNDKYYLDSEFNQFILNENTVEKLSILHVNPLDAKLFFAKLL